MRRVFFDGRTDRVFPFRIRLLLVVTSPHGEE
jgi:hypothetical protein